MQLRAAHYEERIGTPQAWIMEEASFGSINLIVGKNASGKSRSLNIIGALASLLTKRGQVLFESGRFGFRFASGRDRVHYEISINDRRIAQESLRYNSRVLLDRGEEGNGFIQADEIGQRLKFKLPEDVIAAVVRRDTIQHPFLEPLHDWAKSVRHYRFGSEQIQRNIFLYTEAEPSSDFQTAIETESENIAKLYWVAFGNYGEEFDRRILNDLEKVGYSCSDVGADQLPNLRIPNGVPIGLFLKENDLPGRTTQIDMSAGMFRVLALVIHLNINELSKTGSCVLIDDIGEGLDYERSKALIKLLIQKCRATGTQLFMSSNDRFVMNDVDLKYWHIIDRTSNKIKLLSYKNSKSKFDEFRYSGLNNFDFFSEELYKSAENDA